MFGSVKIDGYVSAKGSFADDYLPEQYKQSEKRGMKICYLSRHKVYFFCISWCT